jgi:hypothetical protein
MVAAPIVPICAKGTSCYHASLEAPNGGSARVLSLEVHHVR